jgi:BarA-like signal transduction histidine kinase
MSDVLISTALSVAYRQHAGGTPAIRWSRLHFRIAGISPDVSSDSQASRLHPRIAGVSPASGCTQPLVSDVLISTALSVAYRQHAGETPAIRWSRLHFKIAGITFKIRLYYTL